jgi:hypothetical protein
MKIMGHVTLNFNSGIYMASVFFDIEKAFEKTGHFGLLYQLFKLKFLISLI